MWVEVVVWGGEQKGKEEGGEVPPCTVSRLSSVFDSPERTSETGQ